MRDEERNAEQEQGPGEWTPRDRLLAILGIDSKKWTVGDRRLALFAIVMGLAIVIIAVCGYVFGWVWTGLAKRTFWDWLNLLIVPVVLALGGYLFTRSENRRTQEVAERQRAVDQELADQRAKTDRDIADQRRQDDALQAYLDHIGELLLDKDKPLRQSKEGDEVRTLARARPLTILTRLDGSRKGTVVRFLYESGLISKDGPIVSLVEADLKGADLAGTDLARASLRQAHLKDANLQGANLERTNLARARLEEANLTGAYLKWANLARTHLEGANLEGAILDEALLPRVHLGGAALPSAHLAVADLSRAHLEEANLEGAILARTKMGGADMSNACLAGTNLSGTHLEGANLVGAKGITTEEVEQQTSFLKGATMPDGSIHD